MCTKALRLLALCTLGFVCKYRRDVLSELAIADLRDIFFEVCADLGATLDECNGEGHHIQRLLEYPPSLALSWLVKKGRSSRLLREWRPEVHGRNRSVLWTPAYFVASCGCACLANMWNSRARTRLLLGNKSRGFRREEI